MKKNYLPIIGMGAVLILTEALGIFLSPFFKEYNLKAFGENPGSLMNPFYLIAMVLGFTAVFLLVNKLNLDRFIQIFIGFAIFVTMIYSFMALIWNFYPLNLNNLFITASIASFGLTLVYIKYKKWYIINLLGLLVGGGAAAIFGFSLEVFPVIILLIILAIYDAIAVYKTKHMISLAGNAISLKIPIMFIIPWKKNFSLNKQNIENGKKDAFFMGVGDTIMPSILIVSSYIYLNQIIYPLIASIGSIIGFILLSYFVMKGKAQAGLPLLNGGTIIGFLIPYLLI